MGFLPKARVYLCSKNILHLPAHFSSRKLREGRRTQGHRASPQCRMDSDELPTLQNLTSHIFHVTTFPTPTPGLWFIPSRALLAFYFPSISRCPIEQPTFMAFPTLGHPKVMW